MRETFGSTLSVVVGSRAPASRPSFLTSASATLNYIEIPMYRQRIDLRLTRPSEVFKSARARAGAQLMEDTANEENTGRGRDTKGFGCERVTTRKLRIPSAGGGRGFHGSPVPS